MFVANENDVLRTEINTFMDNLLQRFKHDTLLRIIAYTIRFVSNCKGRKFQGLLGTAEINNAEIVWIKLT